MNGWRSVLGTLAFWAAVSTLGCAPDVSGKWKYEVKNPRGTREQSFVLKQESARLTGYIFSPDGVKEEIQEGKVQGREIEFSVVRRHPSGDNPTNVTYKGKVVGDEIQGHYIGPGGNAIEWTAKRETLRTP